MSKRDNGGDVNVSPMSDRGGSTSAGGGFGYLQPKPPTRGGVEVALDLPSTVTRRAPGGKRTLTPRGNPFATELASAPPLGGVLQSARRPIAAARGKQRVDPFAGAAVMEAEPSFAIRAPSARPAAPRDVSIPQPSPPSTASVRRTPPRSPSGGRHSSKAHVSPPAPPARKSVPPDHVSVSSLLSSIQAQQSPPTLRKSPATPVISTTPTDSVGAKIKFPTSDDDATNGRGRGSVTFVQVRRGASLCFQLSGVLLLAAVLLLGAVVLAAPLFLRFDSVEDLFVRDFVPSVSQLQKLYQEPAFGLNASETRCLYLRVLEDRQGALERALAPYVANTEADAADQVLRLEQVSRAHHMLRHRVRLYARSRDNSILNHLIFYPLRDPIVYGLIRHGWADTLKALFWKPDVQDLFGRVLEAAVCAGQSEQMPCPSFAFVEEKAHRAVRRREQQAGSGTLAAPLEHARAVSKYITDRSASSNSWYNDNFCTAMFNQRQQRKLGERIHADPSLG